MNNALDAGIFFEHAFERREITAIHLFESRTRAADFFDAVDDFGFGVAEIVDNHDVVTCSLEFNGGVRTDEAGTARDKNGLFHFSVVKWGEGKHVNKGKSI